MIEVEGLTILITPEAEVEGILSVGAEVEVEAVLSGGNLVAKEIEVEDEDEG